MANTSILTDYPIVSNTLVNFVKTGWPACLLITGERNRKKSDGVDLIAGTYFSPDDPKIGLSELSANFDYIDFDKSIVAIGKSDSPEVGTIRHLLRHILPYAPRGGRRLVRFRFAEGIRDEAESALLKTLEEPPLKTTFLLEVVESSDIKETILSRSLCLHFPSIINCEDVPVDPWSRFWYFTGFENEPFYNQFLDSKIIQSIEQIYNGLKFDPTDLVLLEDLFLLIKNQKLSITETSIGLRIAYSPMLFSLRDALLEGKVPTIGPIRLASLPAFQLREMLKELMRYFSDLDRRIFGSRFLHLPTITYKFLSSLQNYWYI